MSLINQVLREVDQRRDAAEARPSAPPTPPTTTRHAWKNRSVVAALATLAIAVPLVVWWLAGEHPESGIDPTAGEAITRPEPLPAEPARPQTVEPDTALVSPLTLNAHAAPQSAAAEPQVVKEPATSEAVATTGATAAITDEPVPFPEPEPEPDESEPEPETLAQPQTAPQISIRRADQPAADAEPMEEAQRALSRGQTGLAEERLRELVEKKPEHHEARRVLATLWATSGRTSDAIDLLEQGLAEQTSPELATLLGRLLADLGEIDRALDMLQAHAPEAAQHPDHQLLHAALLRQSGQHAEALVRYQALTEAVPANAAAWVGLAASHEALGQPELARLAYRQALRLDQGELAAFARGRLQALGNL